MSPETGLPGRYHQTPPRLHWGSALPNSDVAPAPLLEFQVDYRFYFILLVVINSRELTEKKAKAGSEKQVTFFGFRVGKIGDNLG